MKTATIHATRIACTTLAALAACSTLAGTVQASDARTDARADTHKSTRATLIFGNATAGALLGGPVGYVLGAATGIWLSDRVVDGYALDDTQAALAQAQSDNARQRARYDARFAQLEQEQAALQAFAADSLQFRVLFHTGDSLLDADSEQRIAQLASFMQRQPQMIVRLSGHADPRGGDAYNDGLSAERVARVTDQLQAYGVAADRIVMTAYGESQSLAAEGDLDSYAFERRVDIELLPAAEAAGLADAH